MSQETRVILKVTIEIGKKWVSAGIQNPDNCSNTIAIKILFYHGNHHLGHHSKKLYYIARKEHKCFLNWEKADSLRAKISADVSGHNEIVPYQHSAML